MSVYAIGQITNIKDKEVWQEYKAKVKDTLDPYNAKILFRGKKTHSLVESSNHIEVVTIEFESLKTAKEWYFSDEYQSIAPLRKEGADVVLEIYE